MNGTLNPTAEILFERRARRWPWLNVVLFLGTCLTTLGMGALLMADFNGTLPAEISEQLLFLVSPAMLVTGVPFSFSILTILFAHEMGHYVACRYYGIDASLPYFIPAPTLVGTMGAFIRIRSPIQTRGALLDVGIMGPIAGFVLAVPVLALSMAYSQVVPLQTSGDVFQLGEPLVFKLVALAMGKTAPEGMALHIHPAGFAAWFGFFATALNLLPAGQLDGGHVTYALFRGFHRWISRGAAAALLFLGIFFWGGWLVWFIVLAILKLKHPPTLDDSIPLERRHVILGWIGLALFILCFTPNPFFIG